jgi:hypothetical protein
MPDSILRGERCGGAKITEQQVRDVRIVYAETKNISETARRVGVPRRAAEGVVHGRTWRHVT